MHIFIDESGSFQSHDPNGVIIFAAIVTKNAAGLRSVIRRSRRAKLRTKKEKQSSEIIGIQVADFIAHDTALKYTRGDTTWYTLFRDHIKLEVNGTEVL